VEGGVSGLIWHFVCVAVGKEQPHNPRMAGGTYNMGSPPGPDVQYGPAGVNLAVPCAVLQLGACLVGSGEAQRINQECLVIRCRAPEGVVVGASRWR
jgi:hypothetical protein